MQTSLDINRVSSLKDSLRFIIGTSLLKFVAILLIKTVRFGSMGICLGTVFGNEDE
jgi:hypothetical protein